MTTPTPLEIQIAAEGSSAVVAGRARVVAGGKVLLRAGRAHLPLLRQPACVAVTVRTVQALARRVISVAKRVTERD